MVSRKIIEKPQWLRKRIVLNNSNINSVKNLILDLNLHTICQSAQCPNIYECFSNKTATFLLMGNICTRNCSFCSVKKGKPLPLDDKEPENIARASLLMNLKYIVLTSVTRDDIEDGGAVHFSSAVNEIKKFVPNSRVECLIPDFAGNIKSLECLLASNPDVVNHNMETVERMYGVVRSGANYKRSLEVLKNLKRLNPKVITKSGFMLGFGESKDEILKLFSDLHESGCDIVTIGQYLRPNKNNFPVQKYYTPEEFSDIEEEAKKFNFKYVVAGIFVRSSYNASIAFKEANKLTKLS